MMWGLVVKAIDALKLGGSLITSATESTQVGDGPRDKYLVIVTVVRRG